MKSSNAAKKTTTMNKHPRTAALLTLIFDQQGGVGAHNAPEKWVKLTRDMEDELESQPEAGTAEQMIAIETMSKHIRNLVQSRNDYAKNYYRTDVARLEAIRERDAWKASHDNQVTLRRMLTDRPDLADRAASIQALIEDRDALRAEVEALKKGS